MPFCPYCGTQLQPQHRFCPNCGKPVEQVAPQQYPQPAPAYAPQPAPPLQYPPQPAYGQPAGERVLGVIGNLTRNKMLSMDSYTLVVTDRRSVFAKMTNEVMGEYVKARREQSGAEGKGFFGKWKDQVTSWGAFPTRYLSMQPDQILAETKGNYAIEHSMLRGVKSWEISDEDSGSYWVLEIQSVQQKEQFRVQYDPKELIKQYYGR